MYERYIKRCLDVIFAVIALPIVLVVCIIFGALIWLEDRGTIFYLAKRRGKDGTIFNMYKLRSMKVNAPDIRNKDNSTFNSADDPRVTKIGKLMRKISVDELPQVFNILKGDIYLLFMIPICVVTAKFGFWIMVYSRCGAIIIQMIIGIVFMKKFFEIDLQDYFKSFLYPLIATIAMILISEVTKWYLKGIIGDFIGILVCVLVYLAVVYVVARKQLLNIIQTIKKEKV